jgi:hypothetical protein
MPVEPCNDLLMVTAEDGCVLMDKVSGVSVALTSFVAADARDNLMNKAVVDPGQQSMWLIKKQPSE